MKRLVQAALVAVVALVLAASSGAARAAGEQAPDFTLRDIDNKEVKLSDFAGRVVLVNFWATWCAPCQVEMPHLERMYKELQAKGFAVLSISADDARSASQVKPLIKRNGYTFPVLLDKETKVVSLYNPNKALPYSVLVDRDGRIAKVYMGYNPGDEVEMRRDVEQILSSGALGGGGE